MKCVRLLSGCCYISRMYVMTAPAGLSGSFRIARSPDNAIRSGHEAGILITGSPQNKSEGKGFFDFVSGETLSFAEQIRK